MDRNPVLGSRWWRFDFHTHTPASNDYGRGDESKKSIEPSQWLRKAMEMKLDAVAVTDHNTGGWIDRIKSEYEALRSEEKRVSWFREIAIYPGVEITVAESTRRYHLLALFDPSKGSMVVDSILGACGITDGFGDEVTTSTKKGLQHIIDEVSKAHGIVIPAHIDGEKGLLHGLKHATTDLAGVICKIYAAEFCDPDSFSSSQPELRRIVDRFAKLGGSDAHCLEDIGKHTTWIRMGRHSIQGLGLALRDSKLCVSNQVDDPNRFPDVYLSSLSISNMKMCGRTPGYPFTMDFHPNFNTLIGGRGTGKSTVLESIGIALRRDRNAIPRKQREQVDLFMASTQNDGVMLEDTEILACVRRNGVDYRLRWRMDGQGPTLEEMKEGEWLESPSGEIAQRFPIHLYSQKQIESLASEPHGILKIIDDTPEVDGREWTSRWEIAKSKYMQLCEHQRELDRQLSTEPALKVELKDIQSDLERFESKGDGEVLRRYQRFTQQANGLPSLGIYDELSTRLTEIVGLAYVADFPQHLFDGAESETIEMMQIHKKSVQEMSVFRDRLLEFSKEMKSLKEKNQAEIESSRWYASLTSNANAYQGLLDAYKDSRSGFDVLHYGEFVRKRTEKQRQLSVLDSIRAESESNKKEIRVVFERLFALKRELTGKRKAFLSKHLETNPYVRMDLVPFGETLGVEDQFRQILDVEKGKFTSSIYSQEEATGILTELIQWNDRNVDPATLPKIVSEMKNRTRLIAQGTDKNTHGAFMNRMKLKLDENPAAFDLLDAWWPDDLLKISYLRESDHSHFEELKKGSAGQKAAAILAFLLSYGEEPLLLDQPEDDLDNAIITDLIVKQIHENRQRRQVVVITHNPNIVVNGDADLVHVLGFEKGQIHRKSSGSLEEEGIRHEICTIMEGGRIAFQTRYHRITLED